MDANHPDVAQSLNNLALLYQDQGRYSEAEPLYQRALSIVEQQLGDKHPLVATSLNNLASLYRNQGRYSEAEPLFQRALSIREQQLEDKHPDVAISLNNLAGLYEDQGRYSEAEPLYQCALSIVEQQLDANHPDVATSLRNLAALYFADADIPRGLELMNRAYAIEETNLALILAVGSEARKQAYMATLSGTTGFPFSLHLQSAPDNSEAAQLALTTALRRKGRVLDAVSDNLRQLRQNLKPADQPLLDELDDVRAQLGTLLFTGAEIKSPEAYKTQVAALQTRAEELENTLAQRSSEFRVESQPVTIESVQSLIPADGAVVEIVRYQPFNLKARQRSERWGTPRYAAYALHSNGDLKWADLGDAEPIDQLVEKFRASLRSQSGNVQTVGRELDAKLMQPIRSLLGNRTHVLLSPDSQLNLIPFAALVDEQNRYLIDTYTFTYFTSGRDLLKLQLDSPSRQAPVLFANPDYDLPGNSEAVQIASTDSMPVASSTRGGDQRSIDLTSLTFDALDGTQLEANAIAPLLPDVTVLTGSQATENVLKQLQAPSILHIATHGFFLQDVECVPITNTRGGTATVFVGTNEQATCRPTPRNTENPLLRSGLAMAGFNPRQSGDEDGVLTAMEATGLNLYGTKLVVMSACETGLGDVANGEGVYGLRRAFVMAGSESQLMSLWKVDDYGTSELMSLYYQRIQNAEGRSQALRQVQQEMRAAPAYAHPYYWAGFIFSGDWSPVEKF